MTHWLLLGFLLSSPQGEPAPRMSLRDTINLYYCVVSYRVVVTAGMIDQKVVLPAELCRIYKAYPDQTVNKLSEIIQSDNQGLAEIAAVLAVSLKHGPVLGSLVWIWVEGNIDQKRDFDGVSKRQQVLGMLRDR